MRVVRKADGSVCGIELTHRNLLVLLAKLDGYPPNSGRTIMSPPPDRVFVRAVEDKEHYSTRPPGIMHRDSVERADRESERLALEFARGYAKALEEYGIQPSHLKGDI